MFEDGIWETSVEKKRRDRRVRVSVLQGYSKTKSQRPVGPYNHDEPPRTLGADIKATRVLFSYCFTRLPGDEAECLSLFRVCVFLLGVRLGCDEVAVPYHSTENRETKDDQEERNDRSAVCLY